MADIAVNLFSSSASGTISTLSLTKSVQGSYSLAVVDSVKDSSPSPSFLLKDTFNGKIYCSDEDSDGPSSISSYSIGPNGSLDLVERYNTLGGSCHQAIFNGGKALAVAEYDASGISTWMIRPGGGLSHLEDFSFTMAKPGPQADRQEAPHPHQIIVDPTDSYLLIPDLGSDLVRIFTINKFDCTLINETSFTVPPGSGPRHGTFFVAGNRTYFYLVSELSSTVIGYTVLYREESLLFNQSFIHSIYGEKPVPEGAYACEIMVSPDNKFLLTCSRLDYLFQIASFDPSRTDLISSDTMQVWLIDPASGNIKFQQLSPCGGVNPRHFSVNKAGTMAAVALIGDGRVVITERNIIDGTFGRLLACVEGLGEVMCVIWDD